MTEDVRNRPCTNVKTLPQNTRGQLDTSIWNRQVVPKDLQKNYHFGCLKSQNNADLRPQYLKKKKKKKKKKLKKN